MLSDELPDPADLMSPVQKPEDPRKQLQKYLQTLSPAERQQYMNNMRGQSGARPETQGKNQMFGSPIQQGFLDYMGPAAHGQIAQQTYGRAMDAIEDENSRRVAMSREMRRMEHERELERMKQETERMKISALIQRLGQQGGYANPAEGLFIR